MFKKAIPVFSEGEENSLNYPLTLCAKTATLKDTTLYITAFSFYRLIVNGKFVASGPARTAKGYARVDEIELDRYNADGENSIEIQVVGYNCGSLSTARQSSFVACELTRGDEVLLYTGRDFDAYLDHRRVREVERYSAQRHFGEVWRVIKGDFKESSDKVELAPASNRPIFLPRRVSVPTYDMKYADGYASRGSFLYDGSLPVRAIRTSFYVSEEWGRFEEDEVLTHPYRWIQQQRREKTADGGSFPITLSEGEYITLDMGHIECGFISWSAKALEESDVVITYSELCEPDDFALTDINCQNVIEYLIEKGVDVNEQSFEPYTCNVAILMVRSGRIELSSFGIRTYEYDRSRLIRRKIKDGELARIYSAAEATFAHNALDLYSDCPSRERAGWLCDSFFTGRAEYFLTGKSTVEDAFLENYRLYEYDGKFPKGVLPMCYPSDEHEGNKFIPQWDMWYVLEVKEYLTERNTSVDKELFRESVCGIVEFLEAYENSDGLLQDLPSWNFVEWSSANSWVQNVNYPTNFLYAEVLRAAGSLYGVEKWLTKAEMVASRTAELSFDGEVFIDNAVLDSDKKLINTRNSSEAGQYYALLFGNMDINDAKYSRLKTHIFENFANFDLTGREFVPVNAFIGFYLKIWALMNMGERELLCSTVKSFFGGMVESTGTLWEYKQRHGSHDHGFAAFAAVAIDFIENT
ncbi:MAG: hypothetical protein E7642_04900 [Ruminococcaceae bacterium]|nr:hypothetical protein [Oscillospiraceae bacterium]